MKHKTPETVKTRPLSPHLTIYKPQISTVLSIGHRLSGIGLFFMIAALSWWFILWVVSKFDSTYLEIFNNSFVKALLVITSYAFFYHLCTGIRHLIWDTGRLFSIKAIDLSGIIAIFVSALLTLSFWMYIYNVI